MSAPIQTVIENDRECSTPAVAHPVDSEVDIEVMRSVPKSFEINDERTANWLVRKVVEARRYSEQVKRWADQEQRRAAREEQTLLFLFGRQIERWAKGEVEKSNGKRKSVNLPAGVIGFQRVNPCLRVEDEDAVLRWAKVNCPAVVTTVMVTKLLRGELKAHFERTGEVPEDGAVVVPGCEKFYLREGRTQTEASNNSGS